ncbi:NAP1-related protein 2-like [Papaver somniferum]|uniref:NAP1-related protein 2-like n=1 Tax=Papaver somniferum TaxID=3469 RepID=UPI000E70044A|nr:NAP1-related protein 2-like [Papaver somniferum]
MEWFYDDHLAKDQDRDKVAEKIAHSLWPYAPVYYINATKTSVSMAAGIHADENGLPVSDSTTELCRRTENEKLMEVHAEFVNAKEAALTNGWDLKEYDLQVETEEKVLRQQKTELCRSIYEKRSETIKDIPFFWLNAFISHGALADILNENYYNIFGYLECVNVEEAEDPTLMYMITLNFNDRNPYFENASLTRTFSHCVEGVDTNGCTIKWKDSFRNGREYPRDQNVGFFTWFSGCGHGSTGKS